MAAGADAQSVLYGARVTAPEGHAAALHGSKQSARRSACSQGSLLPVGPERNSEALGRASAPSPTGVSRSGCRFGLPITRSRSGAWLSGRRLGHACTMRSDPAAS